MKRYLWDDLRELYRVDNKYWKTGDVDILEKRMAIAKRIDEKYWDSITSLTAFTTRQRLPFNKLVDAMRIMGYEPYEEGAKEEVQE